MNVAVGVLAVIALVAAPYLARAYVGCRTVFPGNGAYTFTERSTA